MDEFDKKCKIEQDNELGRYLTAAIDIKAGETIMLECPVLILSANDERRCSNCFLLANEFCSKCKVFPLCGNCNTHNDYDCNKFVDMNELKTSELQKGGQIYGVLKCLLLRENTETAECYKKFIQLEAHLEERRNTEVWDEIKKNVVTPIINSGLPNYLKSDEESIDEELLQRLCSIVDVNCFEIRAPDTSYMRAVYLNASLMSHQCVTNTVVAIDDNYKMKVYANRDITQGEMLLNCYTNVLLGTEERRQNLKLGKYFFCTCARCEDPTELGSHMSSLICPPCAQNKRDGFVVKKNNKWQCLTCQHTVKTDFVENILERAKEEIFHAKDDIYRYELLLGKLNRFFHRNHYMMIDIKQNVAAILRSIILNLAHRPGRKVYERKVRLCQEILNVLQIIQPGISRLKAIALYELCNASAELHRMRFNENEISQKELKELLQQSESMLRESIRMLLYEPVETPEGKLAKSMLKELKDLQNDMDMLKTKF
ncbi:SET domain-containing protein SmydA-8-like [Teleopsis dalmanni]|uniref:SET domain-containing protein SmydA-8-like n=1 Tax=Teleopsis dalmanni TaxID=139649 RepID=UPI0018CD1265|nr:SET domain-containing protein SmydA-8-like [Teleopsis dalmanni]